MNYSQIPCPELLVQTAGMPEAGTDLVCDVPFASLDLEDDERFLVSESTLHVSLHLAIVKSDLIVTGHLSGEIRSLCDRCAEWAPLLLTADDVFHQYKNVFGDPVDLTEDIREDILLTFPQSFLCSEDCKGLCPTCGQNLNLSPCGCEKQDAGVAFEEKNPWAALDDLKLK